MAGYYSLISWKVARREVGKGKVARALEKMAQRTPAVTAPPAEPSGGCRITPSGRRNKTTNGGGPYSSFGHQTNLHHACICRLLKNAHFLKCEASAMMPEKVG